MERQIDVLAEEIEECKIIQSIPGIGGKIAATIISEIGEIDRFNHPKKLVAYAGIDPSIHSSGKFTNELLSNSLLGAGILMVIRINPRHIQLSFHQSILLNKIRLDH
ncbi:transposase [Metabacillus sp. RGM 3146]|uniref:transposase n=1 Tax=Metabacillus sp. RGM 3146 TaxID=3401092 RepID=UPI003B9C2068